MCQRPVQIFSELFSLWNGEKKNLVKFWCEMYYHMWVLSRRKKKQQQKTRYVYVRDRPPELMSSTLTFMGTWTSYVSVSNSCSSINYIYLRNIKLPTSINVGSLWPGPEVHWGYWVHLQRIKPWNNTYHLSTFQVKSKMYCWGIDLQKYERKLNLKDTVRWTMNRILNWLSMFFFFCVGINLVWYIDLWKRTFDQSLTLPQVGECVPYIGQNFELIPINCP